MQPIILPMAELKPALSGLSKVINRQATLPVLSAIKIERSPDGWTSLTATDLDRFISVRLEQPVKGEPMALLVPYEQLATLAKSCAKDERPQLEPGPNHTAVIRFALASQQGEAKTASLRVDEFPLIPKLQGEAVVLPDPVRHALLEAMQCSSTDDTRAIIQGAFIDVSKPGAHYVVATDGRHLYTSNSFRLPLHQSLTIPKHKFLAWREFNLDGAWQIKVGDTIHTKSQGPPLVQISSRRWRFITRQLEGTYPNWRQVVPDSQPRTTLTLDPSTLENLMQVIERLSCHDERYRTIGLEWKDRHLHLLGKQESSDPWTRVPVSASKGEGPDATVLLDRQLLLKALQFGLNTIGIIDEISPLRFSQGGRQMIVMPLRGDAHAPRDATPRPKPINGSAPAPRPQPPKPAKNKPTAPVPPPAGSSTLDHVIDGVHHVRESFQSGLAKLRDLSLQLKQLHREQRSNSREMQNVRSTLRSLQGLKL